MTWAFAWPLFDYPDNQLNPNKESHFNYLREKLHFYSNIEIRIRVSARKYQHTIQFYDILTKNHLTFDSQILSSPDESYQP